jgi:hypothetical protein
MLGYLQTTTTLPRTGRFYDHDAILHTHTCDTLHSLQFHLKADSGEGRRKHGKETTEKNTTRAPVIEKAYLSKSHNKEIATPCKQG